MCEALLTSHWPLPILDQGHVGAAHVAYPSYPHHCLALYIFNRACQGNHRIYQEYCFVFMGMSGLLTNIMP